MRIVLIAPHFLETINRTLFSTNTSISAKLASSFAASSRHAVLCRTCASRTGLSKDEPFGLCCSITVQSKRGDGHKVTVAWIPDFKVPRQRCLEVSRQPIFEREHMHGEQDDVCCHRPRSKLDASDPMIFTHNVCELYICCGFQTLRNYRGCTVLLFALVVPGPS